MKSLPELVTDQDIREMFDTADDDGDGLIDIEEFGRMVIYQSYLWFLQEFAALASLPVKY